MELPISWTRATAAGARVGGSTMPLAELNRRRQAYLDSKTDYVKEDGTVIPAAYVKMRSLIHTYGMGAGNTPSDTCFDNIVSRFTEEEAQAYVEMPLGIRFTPLDFSIKTGRPIEASRGHELHAAQGLLR